MEYIEYNKVKQKNKYKYFQVYSTFTEHASLKNKHFKGMEHVQNIFMSFDKNLF